MPHVLGGERVHSVFASSGAYVQGFGGESQVDALMLTETGRSAVLQCTLSPGPLLTDQAFLRVVHDGGEVAVLSDFAGRGVRCTSEKVPGYSFTVDALGFLSSYDATVGEFVTAVDAGGRLRHCCPEEAYHDLEIVEAMYRSAKENEKVIV